MGRARGCIMGRKNKETCVMGCARGCIMGCKNKDGCAVGCARGCIRGCKNKEGCAGGCAWRCQGRPRGCWEGCGDVCGVVVLVSVLYSGAPLNNKTFDQPLVSDHSLPQSIELPLHRRPPLLDIRKALGNHCDDLRGLTGFRRLTQRGHPTIIASVHEHLQWSPRLLRSRCHLVVTK